MSRERPRVLLFGLMALATIGLLFVGGRPTGHEHGLVARARQLSPGDPDAKVRRLLGEPLSTSRVASGETDETFEAAGERVVVGLDSGGVVRARAYPNINDPWSSFTMLTRRGGRY